MSEDGVYCVYCVLFPKIGEKNKTFAVTPVKDWSNISHLVERHLKNGSSHHTCAIMADQFLQIASDNGLDVLEAQNKAYVAQCLLAVARRKEVSV